MAKLTRHDLPRHRPRLVALARHLGLSHAAAEDAAQSTLLAALQRLQAGAEITRPEAYLNTALRHGCRADLGRAARQARAPDADPVVPCNAETVTYLAEVLAAIDTLPPAQADLLRRVAAGEDSPCALARQTGLPLGTVMSRLGRGRAALRARLERDHR